MYVSNGCASFVFVLIEGALGAGLSSLKHSGDAYACPPSGWLPLDKYADPSNLLTITAWSASTGRRLISIRDPDI